MFKSFCSSNMHCQNAIESLSRLAHLPAEELCDLIRFSVGDGDRDGEDALALYIVIAQFISKSCGQLDKLPEVIAMLTIKKDYGETYAITHNRTPNGPDLWFTLRAQPQLPQLTAPKKWGAEIKCSVVRPGDASKKVNWTFTFSNAPYQAFRKAVRRDAPEAEQHQCHNALVRDMKRKQSGFVFLVVQEGLEKPRYYALDGLFMALYCAEKVWRGGGQSCGLRTQICQKCRRYHLMHHLSAWSLEFETRRADMKKPTMLSTYFSDDEWSEILPANGVKTQCDGNRGGRKSLLR